MKRTVFLLLITLGIFTACKQVSETSQTSATKLEIKDGWYYINGEKTFINALGYEIGARPGQHPYKDSIKHDDLARMEQDLKIIKAAGFNAVRTWSELNEKQVQVIQKSGLKLIYGIWIIPDGKFSDPEFVKAAEQQVRNDMAFTKKYDCIITYLIMNEPMVAHIVKEGAQNTVDLWTKIIGIIHEEHPGIPVTISDNAQIGEYINQKIFDVYGFNSYDYNEGLTHTQTFAPSLAFLKAINGENKPMIITEFGMSVSDLGWGMYGGNTLKKQAEHVVNDVAYCLDAGAVAICPFYYADGWWKGGEPAAHNNTPEEWFGYWGYADVNDTVGHPRPVWYAISEYNQGIVTSPRNQQIFSNTVPVEGFLNEGVTGVKVIYEDKVILDKQNLPMSHFTDTLTFSDTAMVDRELVFEFYDNVGKLVKYESIMILTSDKPVVLPTIGVSVAERDLSKGKICKTTFKVTNDSKFKLVGDVEYNYSHHIGWNAGPSKSQAIKADDKAFTFTDSYEIPAECYVLTISSGITVKFGKFVKRIHGEDILYRGNWADAIKVNK
jgi:exo-beta-1,3-glucanase (GH17 family)